MKTEIQKNEKDFDQTESERLNEDQIEPNLLAKSATLANNNNTNNNWSRSLRGLMFVVVSELFLATSNIFMKKAELFSDVEQALVRYILQLLTMLLIIHLNELKIIPKSATNDSRRNTPVSFLILRGVFGTLSILLTMRSLKLINPSDTIALVNLNVVFVAILARCFLPDEKLTLFHIISIPVVLIGNLFISFYYIYLKSQNFLFL